MPDRKAYTQLVRALTDMMAQPRDDREPYLRDAAEKIVELRSTFKQDGLPDWAGNNPAYKAAVQSAYREAGVPPDSQDTVQAALRYHVGNVVREVAPKDDIEALGLDPEGPAARLKREPSRRRSKATKRQEAPSTPSILSRALDSPVALVTTAIGAIEAARELKPQGRDAETIKFLLRTLQSELDALCAVLGDTDF